MRFPGGENCRELCARLRRALCQLADAGLPAGQASLVVAHGASLRAALPALTGLPDPGADLPTGTFATLDVSGGRGGRVRVAGWLAGRCDAGSADRQP